MKTCSKCNILKDLNEFHIDNSKQDKRKTICKECRSVKRINIHKDLDRSISRSMYNSIKRNKSGYIWERTVNLTLKDLKTYLEKQFIEDMSWDNYGSYWIIDKIIPTSFFRYSDRINNEFKKAWSLKNFRPVLKKYNYRKKHQIISELVEQYKLYDILPIGLININLLTKNKN